MFPAVVAIVMFLRISAANCFLITAYQCDQCLSAVRFSLPAILNFPITKLRNYQIQLALPAILSPSGHNPPAAQPFTLSLTGKESAAYTPISDRRGP
jgi:hypothetical protein